MNQVNAMDPHAKHLAPGTCILIEPPGSARNVRVEALNRMGFVTAPVDDVTAALERLGREPPRYMIFGDRLVGDEVVSCCRTVRDAAALPYVHMLAAVCDSSIEARVELLEAGVDTLLKSPLDLLELLAQLRAHGRLVRLEDHLRAMSHTDPLTGVGTKPIFLAALKQDFAKIRRHGGRLACVMLDIDYFKQINDVRGHLAGDMVLQEIARTISKNCRTSDSLCRFGGEEFCILLRETDELGAKIWADRLRTSINGLTFEASGQTFRVTASYGVAEVHEHMEAAEQVVETADMALLTAKQTGRDRVVLYGDLLRTEDDVNCQVAIANDAFGGYEARHAMTHVVATLRPHHSVAQAVQFFIEFRLSSAPVVDDDQRLVGIVSEKDLINYVFGEDSAEVRLDRVIKPNVITYEETTPLRTVYDFLRRVTLRAVVVVKDGRPTGMVSRSSLLRWWKNVQMSRVDAQDRLLDDCSVREKFLLSVDGLLDHLDHNLGQLRAAVSLPRDERTSQIVGAGSQIEEVAKELLERCQQIDGLQVEKDWKTMNGASSFVTGWHDDDVTASANREMY